MGWIYGFYSYFASSSEVFLPKQNKEQKDSSLGSFLDFRDGSMVGTCVVRIAGGAGLIPGKELKSHMLHSRKKIFN